MLLIPRSYCSLQLVVRGECLGGALPVYDSAYAWAWVCFCFSDLPSYPVIDLSLCIGAAATAGAEAMAEAFSQVGSAPGFS